jgi:hypothetical protein
VPRLHLAIDITVVKVNAIQHRMNVARLREALGEL